MRALIQRAKSGSVMLDGTIYSSIGEGLVVFIGVAKDDSQEDVAYIAKKLVHLRIFSDQSGKLNLSLLDVGGQMLLVSQFTLYGDCRRGLRPSFDESARPDQANELYEALIEAVRSYGVQVKTGVFQADMLVGIENDGPVTILLESKKL